MGNIVVIDSGMGNIGSVVKKMDRISVVPIVTSNRTQILSAAKIILPGVGHFASGVKKLKENGVWDALIEAVLVKKIPILGICLGMQLLGKHSEEGDEQGFGWIDANVVHFKIMDKNLFKIPHTGWNTTVQKQTSPLLSGINDNAYFYFVHAYHMICNNPLDTLTITNYSYPFVSAVSHQNIFGVQFHPEKSHGNGEKLLRNFINL